MATYFIQNTNSVEDIEQMNNVIDKVNQANTTATSNIGQLTDLNNKAQELSNDIQQVLPINTELKENIKIGQPLVQEAIEKNTELQASLEEAKEFIDGLDGSQDIPSIRMELTKLQNGLKSNQALAYQGSSISAENTLEGRTEEMKIKGKTLFNIHAKANYNFATNIPQENYTLSEGQNFCEVTIKKYPSSSYCYINAGTINFDLLKPNQKYTLLAKATDGLYPSVMTGGYEFPLTSNGTSFKNGVATMTTNNLVNGSKGQILYINLNGGATYKQELRDVMIFEGDLSIIPCSYFEGIKSFGEAEQEGDKYKISILSSGKNILTTSEFKNLDSYGKKVTILNSNSINIKDGGLSSWKNYWHDYVLKANTDYIVHCQNVVVREGEAGIIPGYSNGESIKGVVEGTIRNNYVAKFNTGNRTDIRIRFQYAWSTPTKADIDFIDIQLEEGTTPTTFEPYKEDKKDILIKDPLRSIGDFSDVMYEDNGQVKVYREAGQYTFTGEEAITKENTLTNITRFYIDIPCKNIINTRNIICNNFNSNGTWWDRDEIGMYWDTSIQGRLWFHIKNGEFNDFEAFRNFLKANPTTIVYQLATPITELYENCIDIDLDTYQDKTYFNILNSLPGTLDFKVPSNIASIVQSNSKAINELYDLINNVVMPGMAEIIDKTVKASMNLAK